MATNPLHKCWYFWCFSSIPLAIALLFGLTIILSEPELHACFSSECYGTFLNLFKIPIATSALAIPVAGIIAAIHRSSETQLQISLSRQSMDITNENNTFSNYIKHKDEFDKILNRIEKYEKGEEFIFANPGKLYRKLFPNNSYTHLKTEADSTEATAFIDSLIDCYSKCYSAATATAPSDEEIFQYYKAIDYCFEQLMIVISDKCNAHIKFGTDQFSIAAFDEIHIQNITVIMMAINRILMFCKPNNSFFVRSDLGEMNHDRFREFKDRYITVDKE